MKKRDYNKYLGELKMKDVLKIWLQLPLREKLRMIRKYFNPNF